MIEPGTTIDVGCADYAFGASDRLRMLVEIRAVLNPRTEDAGEDETP